MNIEDTNLTSLIACIDANIETHEILQFQLGYCGHLKFRAPKMVEVPIFHRGDVFICGHTLDDDARFDPGFGYDSSEEHVFKHELRLLREMYIESLAESFPLKTMSLCQAVAFNDRSYAGTYDSEQDIENKCPGFFARWGTWRGYLVKLSVSFMAIKNDDKSISYQDEFVFEICKDKKAFSASNKTNIWKEVKSRYRQFCTERMLERRSLSLE